VWKTPATGPYSDHSTRRSSPWFTPNIIRLSPIIGGLSGGEHKVLEGALQIPGEIFPSLERAESCDGAATGLPGSIESCDEGPTIAIPLK
jgi:hypothetical protein